ncbi:MAG: phosphoribosyltransferase family protein, partial [Chlamydiota bacterium]
IEGVYKKGQNCLIVEDVISSGASILETIAPLENEGLIVEDVVVVLNREQGGVERVKEKGVFVHSLISVFDLLKVLFSEKKITETAFREINEFLFLLAKSS